MSVFTLAEDQVKRVIFPPNRGLKVCCKRTVALVGVSFPWCLGKIQLTFLFKLFKKFMILNGIYQKTMFYNPPFVNHTKRLLLPSYWFVWLFGLHLILLWSVTYRTGCMVYHLNVNKCVLSSKLMSLYVKRMLISSLNPVNPVLLLLRPKIMMLHSQHALFK